jgi:inhibitor of KinA sporulation pathway (predicted exonuclease)
MSWIMVDIEADGPIPGDFSMIEIGAVLVDIEGQDLSQRFSANLRPISDKYEPDALSVSGYGRDQTQTFEDPTAVMERFEKWVEEKSVGKPIFISDNNGFDWMFVCWYLHHFCHKNPFGHSSANLGWFYKGLEKDFAASFKGFRAHAHTHKAIDDALGNAEAFLAIIKRHNLRTKR